MRTKYGLRLTCPVIGKPQKIKWIFKKKADADSSVTIYKARLVEKGFDKVQGVDYDEIFSLIAMLKSVRIMLANCHIL